MFLRRLPLAAESLACVVAGGLLLRLLPARRTSRLLGRPDPSPAPAASAAEQLAGRRIGRAVERVARAVPWDAKCLDEALAARWMLRRRGIDCRTHLGFSGGEEPAHAWVTVGGAVVAGGGSRGHTELVSLR